MDAAPLGMRKLPGKRGHRRYRPGLGGGVNQGIETDDHQHVETAQGVDGQETR